MGKNDFFLRKKPWSEIKDKILDCYITPYIAKIMTIGSPLRIADCFAGCGIYKDDSFGSPIYLIDNVEKYRAVNPKYDDIKVILMEKKYHQELAQNLTKYPQFYGLYKILQGTYEDHIRNFISNYDASDKSIFLYIDPYGIKSLKYEYFEQLKTKPMKTFEVLMNFNSFGFLREGARIIKEYDPIFFKSNNVEYESDIEDVYYLDDIAGGNYWQDLIRGRKEFKSFKEMEEVFKKMYKKKLRNIFKYILDVPIREKGKYPPKYRLIFGTNSRDGLFLMLNNMNKRWHAFNEDEKQGNLSLFEFNFPNLYANYSDPREKILEFSKQEILIEDLYVRMITEFGISYSIPKLNGFIKDLEKEKSIDVQRALRFTKTGKLSKSFDYKERKILIKRNREWQKNLL